MSRVAAWFVGAEHVHLGLEAVAHIEVHAKARMQTSGDTSLWPQQPHRKIGKCKLDTPVRRRPDGKSNRRK